MTAEATPAQSAPKKKFEPIVLSEEKRNALEEEHEDILVLKGPEKAPWVVVLKRPTRQQAIAYKNHAKRNSETANEQLVRATCVFPTGDDFDRQLTRWPFSVDGIADSQSFKDFVGIAVDESVK